jgi:hypothetical protein
VLGTANNTTTIDQIPDEVDEKSDEYTEPDEDESSDQATLDKISASKSGRLPPFSHQHPHGVSDQSLSQSFVNTSKEKDSKNASLSRSRDKSRDKEFRRIVNGPGSAAMNI